MNPNDNSDVQEALRALGDSSLTCAVVTGAAGLAGLNLTEMLVSRGVRSCFGGSCKEGTQLLPL